MIHFSNLIAGSFLIYAGVTRGALAVAWSLGRLFRKTSSS